MNQILNNGMNRTSDKVMFKIVLLLLVICVIIAVSTIFALNNKGNENIIKNVFIEKVDVGDKSKDDAEQLIEAYVNSYRNKSITLLMDGKSYKYTAKELGFAASNAEKVIEQAYNYGREGNLLQNNFAILFSNFKNRVFSLEYDLNSEVYSGILTKIASENEAIAADDIYEEKDDEIVITKGQDGLKIDEETLKTYIYTAILNDITEVKIPVINSESEKIDFDKLFEKVFVAPQDASFTSGEKFEVIVEKEGKDFDLEASKAEYSKLKSGETMTIKLTLIEPKVKIADLDTELFKDTFATYTTVYDQTDKDRVQNLITASTRCNETIIYPGQEFSFHKTIGTRTIANGYLSGHSFAGGKVVNSIGGGICQISSTLYNIVLMSDLEVTERTAHGMYVEYVKPSLDATISEGVFDFKFKNNKNYPIMIESSVANGIVTMSIKGIKEKDDKIIEIESVVIEKLDYKTVEEKDPTLAVGVKKVVQEPVEGYISEAYKIVKDSNGKEISRTLISKDKYIPTNKIVKVGTKVSTPVVVPPKPVEPEPEVNEPERELPPGWDSPESPYVKLF